MTTLVTGASGFLGGHLVDALVKEGETVRVLARPTSDLSHLDLSKVERVVGDLSSREALARATKDVTHVYHCAGLSADWGRWEDFVETNVEGVQRLLHAAHENGRIERFLHVSTTDVYGYPRDPCAEAHGLRDVGLPYNRSKALGEKAVWDFYEQTGMPCTVVRPVSIYGPRSKDFVIEIAKLLIEGSMMVINGGRARAGLLYVDNAVRGIVAAATSDQTIGKAYNLRDGADVTWRQYVDALAEALGVKRPWLDLPERIALGIGRAFEGAFGALRITKRPLLTRHAVYILCRDQGYPIERAMTDLGRFDAVGFNEAMARIRVWLASEEGRSAVWG